MATQIIMPAILTRFNRRADKSCTVAFNTNELSPAQFAILDNVYQHSGFLMFKDSEVNKVDEEIFDSLDADLSDPTKTPSKRLRSVLYLNWQNENKGHAEYKDYYKSEMERIITHYKDKLD